MIICSKSGIYIESPYDSVDWLNHGQYNAALHTHTTNSDGKSTLSNAIEEHYNKGYDILAITDHNQVTADWVSAENGITRERLSEITSGAGRNDRGMLMLPYTNEPYSLNGAPGAVDNGTHFNSYFAALNNIIESPIATFEQNLESVEKLGGFSILCHPSWTHNFTTLEDDFSWDTQDIDYYTKIFVDFPSLVGVEIANEYDNWPNDRSFWDAVLLQTIPQGKYVWGFAADDSHNNPSVGINSSVFIMADNNLENFKTSLTRGNFYSVTKAAKRELGDPFAAEGPKPVIKNIDVNNKDLLITIAAEHYTEIHWIFAGEVIATGNTIDLKSFAGDKPIYVRANIIGPGGIAFTQPFGIIYIKECKK